MKVITTHSFSSSKHLGLKLFLCAAIFCITVLGLISCDSTYDTVLYENFILANSKTIIYSEEISDLSTISENGSITLSWTNPSDSAFTGVVLSCNPPTGVLSSAVSLEKDATSFPVTGLTNGTQYTFVIKSKNKENHLSNGVSISATPLDEQAPENVTDIKAISGNARVTLSWENPNDKDFNGIIVTATPALDDGEVVLDKNTTSQVFTNLQNNADYTFTIKTFDTANNRSSGKNIVARPTNGGTDVVTSSILVSYLKDKIAYDFGYCSSATTKEIELTSSKEMTVSDAAITAVKGAGSFTLVSVTPSAVSSGENFVIKVTYTPSGDSWDEADLSFGGEEGTKIRLIGSGYKQPNNIGSDGSLKLWLRADMISAPDLAGDLVQSVFDYSGNNFNAIAHSYSTSPIYTPNGINGLPTIKFDGKKYLKAGGDDNNPIVDKATGTTTFVVYKLSNRTGYKTIFHCQNKQNHTIFPQYRISYRYYDIDTGYNPSTTARWGFAVSGIGISEYRWAYDSIADGGDDIMDIIEEDKPYSSSFRYNGSIATDTAQNIDMWINQTKKSLSYFYSNIYKYSNASNGGEGDNYYTTKESCVGAYGKPVSDGNGNRHSDLGNEAIPATGNRSKTNSTNQWVIDRLAGGAGGTSKGRINDYGYSLASGSSNYLRNHATHTENNNDTIVSVYLGDGNESSSYFFIGDISEMFIFSRALTDTEVDEMNKYLKLRYGIVE